MDSVKIDILFIIYYDIIKQSENLKGVLKMKKFLVMYENMKHDESFTRELLVSHINFVKDLDAKGILYLGGPLKPDEKAMLILMGSNYDEIDGYMKKDPFIISQHYQRYTIYEIIEGNAENNYLLYD
jgi:uncharacterized protein YciI